MASVGDLPDVFVPRAADYSGRRIGPLRLARGMLVSIVGAACILAALAVCWPTAAITIVFLQEHLGASKTEIGLNLTLVTIAMVASLPGAWMFSRLQRRRGPWVLLTSAARIFMIGPALVALLAGQLEWRSALIWIFMGCLLMVQAGSVFTSPGWWSWMGDLIPESIRGLFFSRLYRWMLLAQSVAAIFAGFCVDAADELTSARWVFFVIFAIAAVLMVAGTFMFWAVPEPARPKPASRTLGQLAREYLQPIRDRAFRKVLIGATGYGFFLSMPMVFSVLFLRGEEVNGIWIGGQASMAFLSAIMVVFAVATALAANHWGRLADRIGHRTVWILCSLAYLTHLSFFFINRDNYTWLALGNAAAFGLLCAGQQVAVQNIMLAMAPAGRSEFYVSVLQSVTALGAALGPVVGGWLADHYRVFGAVILPSGQPVCYIHVLLTIAFAGMLLTLAIMARVPDPKGTALLPWFARLVSGELLRTVWNLSALATPSNVPRRVRALRRVSQRDGNLLLPEITAALDDSDLTVRREALLALGRLGTDEAMDLLRWYLHEPDAALRAPSVEAIARARTPDRTTLLKRALRDPHSQVRRAAVEALGRSGDVGASDALRDLLANEPDGEVLASAAVALSKLGEFRAVRQMLPLALRSANTTVRSQMLVALANLLGGTDDFQKLWRRDRHWRGSGFSKLTKKLRRQARVLVRTSSVHQRRPLAERRRLVSEVDNEAEVFLEHVESEDWKGALGSLWRLSLLFLELRYAYHGDEQNALEFVAAVAPAHAERYWLVSYLRHACQQAEATEAPWDRLTLLAVHVLVHGQPPA